MAKNEVESKDTQNFLMLMGAIGMLALAFYFFKDDFIAAWLLYIRLEANIVLLTNNDHELLYQANQLIDWAKTVRPEDVELQKIKMINSNIIGDSNHNYIFILIVGIFGFFLYKKWGVYKGVPSLDSLLDTEHAIWPTQEFVKRFDPSKQWESELRGIGRYPVTPFIHGVESGYLKNMGANSKHDRIFDEDKCVEACIDALGVKAPPLVDLPPFYKVLAVLTSGKWLGEKQYPQYNELLRFFCIELADVEISVKDMEIYLNKVLTPVLSYLSGNEDSDLKECPKILVELVAALKKNHKDVLKVLKKEPYSLQRSIYQKMDSAYRSHAYLSTYAVALCVDVKEGGKYPPGRLVFFRPWDRKLYLIISNAPYFQADVEERYRFISGFSTEVLGVFSHYQHEEYARRKIETPIVYSAVEGIKKRLKEQNLIG